MFWLTLKLQRVKNVIVIITLFTRLYIFKMLFTVTGMLINIHHVCCSIQHGVWPFRPNALALRNKFW